MNSTRVIGRKRGGIQCLRMFLLAALLITGLAFPTLARAEDGIKVEWGPDYQWLRFNFLKQECEYARDMVNGQFPPAGQPPVIQVYKQWPVVALHARWTASVNGWPAKYRADAVDLMLMFACDAEIYEYLFPDVISSSRFIFPPEFLKEANDSNYQLAKCLRGKEVAYQITAKAGFGASDYTMRTRIRIGLTEDEKTVFFHDRPEYISEHLTTRQYFFAGRDEGDCIRLEARIFCVCAPRWFFQDETMRRIEATSRYFVQRIYACLDDAPTTEEIEAFFALIKDKHQTLEEYLKKHGGKDGGNRK